MSFGQRIDQLAHNGITNYLKQYLEWAGAMNYSDDTRRKYEYSVCMFIAWCDPRGLARPHDVTRAILERYRKHMYHYRKADGRPLSFSTQRSHLTPLKAFFKWLAKENHILFNPASDFDMPRVPQHLPKDILSAEEIEAILRHTQVYGDIGIRDRAIFETLYSCGIRRKELAGLTLRDIDFVRGTLVVFEGKGLRDRVIPIGKRACAWVYKYLEDVRPSLVVGEDAGHLFLTDYGEPFLRNRVTDLVKKYFEAVGIDKPGGCHLFRHSMATHMLENGADIRYIQAILGHGSLKTTEIYTRVSIKKLKEVHTTTHPAK